MLNGNESQPTDVRISTSNGYVLFLACVSATNCRPSSIIKTNLTLIATTDDHSGGAYKVSTKTSNSPLDLVFLDAPVDSLLHFDAQTSNSPARAALHPTFEGGFKVETGAWFRTDVETRDGIEDPAGKGRERSVKIHSVRRGIVEGTARWVPSEDRVLGSASVKTSNSPVHLIV